MKTHLSLLFISLFLFSACSHDDDDAKIKQLDFTCKNMATLITKSTSYIKSASPGTIMQQFCTETKLNFLYTESTTLGNLQLFYSLISAKCDWICIYSYDLTLEASYKMIAHADSELGAAYTYRLIYTNSESVTTTRFFDSLAQAQTYISTNGIELAKINSLLAYYPTTDYYYYAGGVTEESIYYPLIEIDPASSNKKVAALSVINNPLERLKRNALKR